MWILCEHKGSLQKFTNKEKCAVFNVQYDALYIEYLCFGHVV